MSSENIIGLQKQIRDNSEDVKSYLLELQNWEKEMKKKEEDLKLIQTTEQEVPPIRNTLYRPKKKSRNKRKDKSKVSNQSKPTDYKAWEKFDAEKEMEKVEEETKQTSDSDNSEDEFNIQKRKQLAILHKDKGNEFYKKGNYDSAINSYTSAMQLDPENPLIAANRAMAFLKKEQYQAAENDCTFCLEIDNTYVKAYFRRGTARKNLSKISLAKDDFMKVLELEPDNREAQAELKKLSEIKIESDSPDVGKKTVEDQKLWCQFTGNNSVTSSEATIKDEQFSTDCIFTDASILDPSLSPAADADEDMTEIKIANMDEIEFRKKIESSGLINKNAVEDFSTCNIDNTLVNIQVSLPPVPVSSFQFLADWNTIESYPEIRYQYLKQFPPEQFPVVFKNYMEPEIFSGILKTLSSSFLQNGVDVFDYLKHLTEVGRFKTMVMFLSDQEQKDLEKLLLSVKSSAREKCEISAIVQKYES